MPLRGEKPDAVPGRHLDRFLMVTLGTGFGASLVDKTSDSGPALDDNLAAPLYQRQVQQLGRADDVLSAFGLARLIRTSPSAVETEAHRARRDPGSSREAFEQYGRHLGTFLAEVTSELEVPAVVIGGGASAAYDLFGPGLEAEFDAYVAPAELASTAE